jgi:hypothetical protein
MHAALLFDLFGHLPNHRQTIPQKSRGVGFLKF